MTVHVLSPTYQLVGIQRERFARDAVYRVLVVFLTGNKKMRPLINFAFDARCVSV